MWLSFFLQLFSNGLDTMEFTLVVVVNRIKLCPVDVLPLKTIGNTFILLRNHVSVICFNKYTRYSQGDASQTKETWQWVLMCGKSYWNNIVSDILNHLNKLNWTISINPLPLSTWSAFGRICENNWPQLLIIVKGQ